MPKVIVKNASLDIPIYDTVGRSLTRSLTKGLRVGGAMRRREGRVTSILALDSIELSLVEGDRVAVFGHNGSGKTSLLKLLAGFYEPSSGSVECQGKVSALLDLMSGMDINLNGYDNILLCGILHGFNRQQIIERVDEIAEFSGLGEYLHIPVRLYSQGMMLRLAFSICTSVDCDILLLDEWIGAGDSNFVKQAKERLNRMIFRSSILVFATHSTEVAMELCNKALLLDHGKLITFGNIHEVVAQIGASQRAEAIAQ
jgi:ABC-type polysaccharide/polyol phosphate transport system ATPase subunit